MNKLLYILLFTGIFMHPLAAQNIQLKASAPKAVETGEQFRITFTLNAKAQSFEGPDFSGLSVLMGPSQSYNQSTSIINGKVSQSVTYTYSYILMAGQEGKYTIGQATATVDGESYQSNALEIEAVKSSGPATGQQDDTPSSTTDTEEISDKNLFVKVLVDKTSAYMGEAIIATIKIYSKVRLAGFEDYKIPSYNGFLKQEIDIPQARSLEREVVNGEIYGTAELQKVVLFPQRTGEIVIDPFESTCLVQQAVKRRSTGSIFDDFFGPSYTNVKKEVKSSPVRISVKPLPAGKPDNFGGAVGNFSFQSTLDKTNVKTNEAITLKLAVSGNGNLKLLDLPAINFPPDFEVYDPKVTSTITPSAKGTSGNKTLEYLFIPRFEGNFRIPPVSFSYFNPDLKKYQTISTPEYQISVAKGEEETGATVVTGFSKQDVKYLGKDIRFIKTGNVMLLKKGNWFLGSMWFYLAYLTSFITFILIILLKRKQIKQNANITYVKNKQASKFARKRLKTASAFLKQENKEKFYEEVSRALWGFLSDKLGIPVADLSRENAQEKLLSLRIPEEITGPYLHLIDACEFARYAPSQDTGKMNEVYEQAVQQISKLQQKLR